jgi:crotonobetainyl-CoA:carnitine CoA-transferase CaiB-like acyl-CoA transferase
MDLDEALDSDLAGARDLVVELDQPGADRPVRLLGTPVKLSRTPADPARAPGPGLGEQTRDVLTEAGYSAAEVDALLQSGAVAGPADPVQSATFMA